jgi:hypothetical protein
MDTTILPKNEDLRKHRAESTRLSMEWLDEVRGHPKLHPYFDVYFVLVHRYMNRDSRAAWPSHPVWAKSANTKIRRVERAVRRARELGYLDAQPDTGIGRGRVKVYRLIQKSRLASAQKPDTSDAKTRQAEQEKPTANSGSHNAVNGLQHQLSEEPAIEHIKEPSGESRADALDTHAGKKRNQQKRIGASRFTEQQIEKLFADWFLLYPRKERPREALQVYRRIIQSGEAPPEQLVSELWGYLGKIDSAVEQEGERARRFILGPVRWLSEKHWQAPPQRPIITLEEMSPWPVANKLNYLLDEGREDEARNACGNEAVELHRDAFLWQVRSEAVDAYRAAYSRLR